MNILLILKGIVVGTCKIIPGVSGSMLAILMGIYEKLLLSITDFFKNPIKNAKFLFNFGIGVFLAIIVFSRVISFLLEYFYYPTMYMFLGLIAGSLCNFVKEIKFSFKEKSIFIVSLILIFILMFSINMPLYTFKGNLIDYLYIMIMGIIDAYTSIIPGISGTLIFMNMGVYEFVLRVLGSPFSMKFFIYGIGIIIGIISVCFLMKFLINKKKNITYSIILAFMVSSIILMLLKIINEFNLFNIIILVIALIIGTLFNKK